MATRASGVKSIHLKMAEAVLKQGGRSRSVENGERRFKSPTAGQAPRAGSARKNRLEVVKAPAFAEIDWLLHGFSTRMGGTTTVYRPETASQAGQAGPEKRYGKPAGKHPGDLNLGFTSSDNPEHVTINRQRFFSAVSGNAEIPTITLSQIHSSMVRKVGSQDAGVRAAHKADGMMTNEPGLLLAIQTADCIPVLIADTKKRAVAGFHAGWRGTVKRIVENGVGRMRIEFGSRPEDLVAAIGPGIGSCCYAVGEEVRDEFTSQFSYAEELFSEVFDSDPVKEKYPLLFMTARAPGHSNLGPSLHLDLWEANRRQLLDAISVVGECTGCQTDRYFSYRAEKGFTGRMFSVIGIRA
jgi:YfiH family protein